MTASRPSDGLLRHSLMLMVATQVANICNLAFHAVMGRALSADYSLLSTMLNIMLIINTPLEALRTAAAHFASRAMRDGDRGAILAFLRWWSVRLLAVAVALCLVGLVGSRGFSDYFHSPSRWPIVITSFTVLGIVFVPFLTGILQGLQSFKWMAAAIQGLSGTRLLLGALLAWTILPNALSGLAAQAIAVGVALLIGGWGIRRALRGAQPARLSSHGSGAYMWKSLFMLSGFSVLMMADMLLVRHYLPGEQAERFARAATIARSIIFLPMPIAFALFPKVVSTGEITAESRRLLFKAFAMVAGLVGLGVGVCLAFPHWPLIVLYNERAPEAVHVVRITISAMAPLALTYLLMNFELAQHRFRAAPGLCVCAVGYIAGVAIWHESIGQIVLALAGSSVAACVWFLVTMPWRSRGPAA